MPDFVPKPSIRTVIRIGEFKLYAYAYRTLTIDECRLAVEQYKRQAHIKKLPSKGSGTILTLFGNNPRDDL